ncbi:peptide chain release factor 3 [Myxococcota bacterium]|nr:peptide chain release factor 3 [Myxococcota bacterium]
MTTQDQLEAEIGRRRTFAIISHPDAGKTTLTEKLLLYSGAIHLAGAVKSGAGRRKTTSDWMELERERGISVTTSVLQFDYLARRVNLLDTPGHNDFSEDTYRTLAAVDAAVMLIDSVKGVEAQTIKLFEVCRMRQIPIVTFINKLDRAGRDPLELLDEIERVLGIPTSPVNWPVGNGPGLKGLWERWTRDFHRFEAVDHGARQAVVTRLGLEDPELHEHLGPSHLAKLREDIELLDHASAEFDAEKFRAGQVTPVFFGSAMNNFGLEEFLERFVDLAPPPRDRATVAGRVSVNDPGFSAFVFKIQANLDPNHRDRVAFARICSGRFERGMKVKHVRTEKTVTLNRTLQFLGQDRELVEEAFAGDVIGIWDTGMLRIGDTLTEKGSAEFEGIPRFSPEHFVRVRLLDPSKRKQLKKGLDQLTEEGAVQMFFDRMRLERDPVLGAVGVLQFDVIKHRLNSEYGAPVDFDRMSYEHARWIELDPGVEFDLRVLDEPGRSTCLNDADGLPVALFRDAWVLGRSESEHPKVRFVKAKQPGRGAVTAK